MQLSDETMVNWDWNGSIGQCRVSEEESSETHNHQEDLYDRQKPEAGLREASNMETVVTVRGHVRHHRPPPTSEKQVPGNQGACSSPIRASPMIHRGLNRAGESLRQKRQGTAGIITVRGCAESVQWARKVHQRSHSKSQTFTEGNMFGREQSRGAMTGTLQGTPGRSQSGSRQAGEDTVTSAGWSG